MDDDAPGERARGSEAGRQGRSADPVQDQVGSVAPGQAQDLLGEVGPATVEDVLDVESADRIVLARGGRGDHACSVVSRQTDGRLTDAAGRGVHDHDISCRDRAQGAQRCEGGRPAEHEPDRLDVAPARGDLQGARRGQRDVLGVRPRPGAEHVRAERQHRGAVLGAVGDDLADRLEAGDVGRLRPASVLAAAAHDVGEVEAGRTDAHEVLPATCNGSWMVGVEGEGARAVEGLLHEGPHGVA
nr:hypothetical protein [Luteipulveratus halotolerans]